MLADVRESADYMLMILNADGLRSRAQKGWLGEEETVWYINNIAGEAVDSGRHIYARRAPLSLAVVLCSFGAAVSLLRPSSRPDHRNLT
jgi:hypothetical protein